MAKIVGTITTVQQYLSKNEVVLVVKPGTPNEDKIILKQIGTKRLFIWRLALPVATMPCVIRKAKIKIP